MFRIGDKVKRKESHNPDYSLGTIIRINEEKRTAEIIWSGDKVFSENWYFNSIISVEDPCDIIKTLV